jgi:hypothetical protein
MRYRKGLYLAGGLVHSATACDDDQARQDSDCRQNRPTSEPPAHLFMGGMHWISGSGMMILTLFKQGGNVFIGIGGVETRPKL